ncbi:MAG: hypothetical protein RXR20_04255, partial [Paraburkholderia sp.]
MLYEQFLRGRFAAGECWKYLHIDPPNDLPLTSYLSVIKGIFMIKFHPQIYHEIRHQNSHE